MVWYGHLLDQVRPPHPISSPVRSNKMRQSVHTFYALSVGTGRSCGEVGVARKVYLLYVRTECSTVRGKSVKR